MRKYWNTKPEDENEENETKEGPMMMLGSADDSKVSVENNKIYFYSGVTRQDNLMLNKALRAIDKDLQVFKVKYDSEPPPIKLHINSYGGSVFAGFGSVDYIRNCAAPVVSVIDGCAASAATIMSVTAHERYMNEHAFMLIHQLSSGMWGKFEAMKDDMKNNEMLMAKIIGIYEQHTKIPKSKIKDILKRDLWWDAKTCLKYGLVDDIITP